MSGQLGELVISLQADLARFQSDMGKANKITHDSMQKMQTDVSSGVKTIQDTLASVAKVFAVTAAVAAGGAMFNDMIAATKNWNGEVMKLSKTMGLTVQESSAYNVALRIAGVDQDIATTATAKLTKTLATNEAAFQKHNIAVRDAHGKMLPMPQIISNTFEALGKLQSGASRNTAAMELFSRSWVQLQSLAKITNPLLAESAQLSDDLGLTLDGKTTEAVKKYSQEMNKLKLVHEAFKVNAGEILIPTLTRIEMAFTKVAVAAAKMKSKQGVDETFTLNLASLVLMEKRLNSAEFLRHPIETVRTLADDLGKMKKAADATVPGNGKDAHSGEEYDPAKAAAEAAAIEQAKQAAEVKRLAALQKENEYVKTYNDLQTERLKVQVQESTELTASGKKIEEMKIKYADLIRLHPEHRSELERNLSLDIENEKVLNGKVDALKLANAEMKTQNKLLEEATSDVAGFGGFARGLGINALELPQIGGQKPKLDLLSGGQKEGDKKPSPFSLTGPSQSSLLGGGSGEVEETQKQKDELLKIEESYNDSILKSKMSLAEQSAGLASKIFGDSKGAQVAALAIQKGFAIAQINMNTAVASTRALAELGPIAGPPMQAEIEAMGALQMGIAIASGVSDAVSIAGKRAAGGPVSSGATYLVGEKGPELFTPGASGVITPNDKIGGAGVSIVNHNDFRGADPATEQRLTAQIKAQAAQTEASILSSMNRGGKFALASGRMK